MMELVKNQRVRFDEGPHTYTLDEERQLIGVTSLLRKHLFPIMYDGIPQEVLDRAAERGHAVHADIDAVDFFQTTPITDEGVQYLTLRRGYLPIANEYLVSDNDVVASCIDCVWHDMDGNIILADIKTTSKIHIEYLQWQLSTYAYLFEMQNPELKVQGLYCAWLPKPQYGTAQLQKIERIPDDCVRGLIQAEKDGTMYISPLASVEENHLPKEYAPIENALVNILTERKALEEKEKRLREGLEEIMRSHNIKKWETERLSITLKEESTRTSFNAAAFKNDYPELAKAYTTTSKVKSSIMFKLKENE